MKRRFSLRALLVMTTVAVVFCYWRSQPRRFADRFIDAIEAEQYDAADAHFASSDDGKIDSFMRRDERNQIHVERHPQSLGDWLSGKCRMRVNLEDYKGYYNSWHADTSVTAEGVGPVLPPSYLN